MLTDELKLATRIAKEAGQRILELYHGEIEVKMKGTADPVTEADTRANAYIVGQIQQAFPGDGIVAEENVDHGDSLGKERIWYVDPLDGTKEFIAKNGEFSVMIGLTIGGNSKMGVVYQPVGDKLYSGVVGVGASLRVGDRTTALQVSETASMDSVRLVVSRSHRSQATDDLVAQLGIQHEVCSGSVGLKVGMIAERRADLYVHLSDRSSAWDACGPEAILVAAGGCFRDLAGEPFVYGGTEMANRRGILACSSEILDEVLPVASKLGRQLKLV
ncbi:MAG: 3'(2'),5'-bisphosphate nucleotidase CysQ [Myxococcota bacterium]